jgi:hypothetical protein
MIVIDPVTLGDVACSRPSAKSAWDRNGTLVQVPPDTLAVTYDPSDLSKAPYALLEPAATNLLPNSEGGVATLGAAFGVSDDVGFAGFAAAVRMGDNSVSTPYAYRTFATVPGTKYVFSVFVCMDDRGVPVVALTNNPGAPGDFMMIVQADAWNEPSVVQDCGNGVYRISTTFTATTTGTNYGIAKYTALSKRGMRVAGYQLEVGNLSSYIKTLAAPGTRAADVITPGAGLVYSNVPIAEQPYDATATYAKDTVVYDRITHLTYRSVIDANKGFPLTDVTKWTKGDVINRWKMLDQYNNTQTSNPDEILLVVSPKVIAQGFYLGNMDANEVRVSVVDLYEGVVYREVQNLVVSTSRSSFFKWFFGRIRRKSYAVSVLLPVYAKALITISIRKIGSTPKCGMCAVGPVIDVGLSEWGIATEIKDYSTTTFQFDGTSDTQQRGFSRRMSLDVEVDNDQKDVVEETLAQFRQKPVAWIGTVLWGSACVFGRYSSFKSVLANVRKSKMSLQIEGTVQ